MKFQGKTATAIILYPEEPNRAHQTYHTPVHRVLGAAGGRAEPEEEPKQTVVREVKEETGLDVKVVRKVGDYHEKGVQGGYEYDYLPACFIVKRVGGEPQTTGKRNRRNQAFQNRCVARGFSI